MDEDTSFRTVKDKFFLTYILFYALGVVTVVPSNFITTATDYWMYKFRDLGSNESYNNDNRTALQAEFTSDYSIVSNVSYMVFIVATIHFVRKHVGPLKRTLGALAGAIALLLLTCIFVKADTDSWQRGFFVLTMIIGFLLTGLCGVFMVTLFEMASKFPPGFIPTIFSGQAICGIFAAFAQIIALGIGGGPQTTGLVYFLIGMIFVLFSLIGFLMSWQKSEYFRYHIQKEGSARRQITINREVILSAVNKSKFYMVSMVITLGCTIMLHPGVISLVISVDKGNGNPWNDTYFGPVINFLFFHLFDYIGREAAMIIKKPTNGIVLLILSCCRIALVPLIIFCNVQPRNHSEVTIHSDFAYVIFLIIFAFTNGFLININIMRVPQVTNDEEKPFAMICILLLMIISLALCSATSTALVKAI